MSNFNTLLENKELFALTETIFIESCNELIDALDEESIQKLEEYSTLLKDKKLKRSLEEEISEALMPIVEVNTVLYGSFLFDTAPIQESCCEDAKSKLSQLRELYGIEVVAEALSPQRRAQLVRAGKIGAGALGAGAAGYKLYQAATGEGGLAGAAERAKDAVTGAGKVIKDKFTGGGADAAPPSETAEATARAAADSAGGSGAGLGGPTGDANPVTSTFDPKPGKSLKDLAPNLKAGTPDHDAAAAKDLQNMGRLRRGQTSV